MIDRQTLTLILLAAGLLVAVAVILWLRMRVALPEAERKAQRTSVGRMLCLVLLLPVVPTLCGGGGGGIGKSAPKTPEIPAVEPTPTPEEAADPESSSVRDAEARKLRQRRGAAGTVLTSPLGTIGQPKTIASTILGGMGG